MSLRNRLVLPVILFALAALVACGNGSTPVKPPPTGGFSNTNLSGTYVFSTSGSDVNSVLIATVGTFSASQGTITGGTMDVNDPLLGNLFGQPITGGSYSVGADGRPASHTGVLVLQTAAGNFVFDFVMTTTEHGLITLFDTLNGTGSGTIDLQSAVTQSNVDGQSYAFNLNGVGTVDPNTGAQTPYSTAGAFKLDASGNIGVTTSGVEDYNDNGLSVCGTNGCTITGGFVDLSTTPGTASFTTNAKTLNFDVYPVDSTHLKLLEVDALPVISGDLFAQSSSIPAGNNVFTMSGFDPVAGGPFTAAGILATDGGGNVTSSSVEDINDFGAVGEIGTVNSTPISGSYTALSGGRSLVTLTGFVNGNGGAACGVCLFAAYPSSGGLQLLEVDNGGVTDGVAYTQAGSPTLASGQGYGMNLAGFNGVEEDDIAEFTNNSGKFTGHVDLNDVGSTTFGETFTSTYAADSAVPGRGVVTPGSNAFNLVTYVVDSSTAVFVETDSNQVGLGSFTTQNATASSNAAARQLTVLRLKPGSKPGTKKALKRH
jgi:hypothetical protein